MNSKQIVEALKNGGYIVMDHPQFGGHRLIRFQGDKGRKLSDVSYWAARKLVQLARVDGIEKIAS